ncbi:hypothetical protein [Microbispora bryophytorum]|uniref:hypothetical protein n=1 Tax=Microbispora bryophytorum TaxID=1460882 RepID=UPI0033CCEEC1
MAGTGRPGAAGLARRDRRDGVPAGQGAQLLHAAREAFTAGLHVTGVIAAVVFAGLAVLVLAMRPRTRTAAAAVPGREAGYEAGYEVTPS